MPNVDDGCDLTTDSFDEANCLVVNTAPDCDDSDNTTADSFDDANCSCINDLIIIAGCTDPCALNFNENANVEDESCTYVDCDDFNDCTVDFYNNEICGCEYEFICSSISGTVFFDENGTNSFDDSDSPVPDMMVLLINADTDTNVDMVFTDENGIYLFSEVPAGAYYLLFEMPNTPVLPNIGGVTTDSDINANGATQVFNVAANTEVSNINAGFVPLDNQDCTDYIVMSSVVCADDNATYSLIITIAGGDPGDDGYLITNNETGISEVIFTNTYLATVVAGSGYDFSVSVVNHPICTENLSETLVDCTVTAVELFDFKGEVRVEGNMLYWQTASEEYSHYFRIQRSIDGINFIDIANVDAAGYSNRVKEYAYMDYTAPTGMAYYRLVEVDLADQLQYSNIISLERETENAQPFNIVRLYPNPAKLSINIDLECIADENIVMKIYDVTGKTFFLSSMSVEGMEAYTSILVGVDRLVSGYYFLEVSTQDQRYSTKLPFVKQ